MPDKLGENVGEKKRTNLEDRLTQTKKVQKSGRRSAQNQDIHQKVSEKSRMLTPKTKPMPNRPKEGQQKTKKRSVKQHASHHTKRPKRGRFRAKAQKKKKMQDGRAVERYKTRSGNEHSWGSTGTLYWRNCQVDREKTVKKIFPEEKK